MTTQRLTPEREAEIRRHDKNTSSPEGAQVHRRELLAELDSLRYAACEVVNYAASDTWDAGIEPYLDALRSLVGATPPRPQLVDRNADVVTLRADNAGLRAAMGERGNTTLLANLRAFQAEACCYGTKEGDGRMCDCKFSSPMYAKSSEQTGCPEARMLIRMLAAKVPTHPEQPEPRSKRIEREEGEQRVRAIACEVATECLDAHFKACHEPLTPFEAAPADKPVTRAEVSTQITERLKWLVMTFDNNRLCLTDGQTNEILAGQDCADIVRASLAGEK